MNFFVQRCELRDFHDKVAVGKRSSAPIDLRPYRALTRATLCVFLALITIRAAGADAPLVRFEQHEFGKLPDGTAVQQFTLRNTKNMVAKIITYGAIIAALEVPDRN